MMKKYRMHYETFEDEHTKVLRKTKPPEFLDPEYYVRAHFHHAKDGTGPFMLNSACRKFLDKQGPFCPPYHLAENELVDIYKGLPAFIFCPGPSLEDFRIVLPPKRMKAINCGVRRLCGIADARSQHGWTKSASTARAHATNSA